MAVEYEISSDVATIKGVASNTQVASIVKFYTGSITYDDEPTSKYASVTINGKTQRVMLCVAVSGTVNYDDVPCLYSTVSGHRTLNVVAPTESGTPDDVPSLYETVVVDGKTVRALRCVLISATPNYDGVSSTCTFTDNGKTHTAQLVNKIVGGSIEVIVKGVSPLSLPDAIADSLSYVKAFGGTEQRNIPQPYTQVNYVTNTASTAVDTGIMIDFAKNYEFEVECRAVSGSWYILQSRASSSGNITGIHGATSGSTITLVVGNVTVCTSAITRTIGNKLYVKATLNNGTATLYVKDETANTEDTQTGSYGTSQPNPTAAVYLLGNAGGQYVDVNSDIYMARIKENDTVVMDYVPARQVATAGFYDKASGTFKTALTPANLSADGNTVPTPDTPMDIVSNNGVVKARHQSGLPLGYTLLDYIQSTETQYIDTDVLVDSAEFRIVADFIPVGNPSNSTINMLCGTVEQSGMDGFVLNGTNIYLGGNNDCIYNAGSSVNGKEIVYDGKFSATTPLRSLTGTINGVAFSKETDTNPINTSVINKNVRIFGHGDNYRSKIKLKSMQIYKNNVLAFNGVPVLDIASNEYGIYDTVSDKFYGNSGTGDFVAGDPVSDPVEIYTDGLQETITIKDDQSATVSTAVAEMLLKIGDYQDVQSILDGVVTRNVGVKVLDGTENWNLGSTSERPFYLNSSIDGSYALPNTPFCTHFQGVASTVTSLDMPDLTIRCGYAGYKRSLYIKYKSLYSGDVDAFKQYLADQYAAGTPVTIVYPLATETTESVAGQTLQVQAGDNTLEITQASLSNLELEAQYQAAVSLTIQEVQDANLDPNVEVTIN